MTKKQNKIVVVLSIIIITFIICIFILNHGFNKTVKHFLSDVVNIDFETDTYQAEQDLLYALNNTPQNSLLTTVNGISLFFHKSGDKFYTYQIDGDYYVPNTDCYKEYHLVIRSNNNTLTSQLFMRENKIRYNIELSVQQQRAVYQYIIDQNILDLDNPMNSGLFTYYRNDDLTNIDEQKNKEIYKIDFIAIGTQKIYYSDDTLTNRTTINTFVKFIEDQYYEDLIKNPSTKNQWP